MPLNLVPTLEDLDIPALESHLEQVRVRRLLMRVQYQQVRNLSLAVSHNKIEARLEKQIEMLGKELVKLDILYDKTKERLGNVILLKNELGLIAEALESE